MTLYNSLRYNILMRHSYLLVLLSLALGGCFLGGGSDLNQQSDDLLGIDVREDLTQGDGDGPPVRPPPGANEVDVIFQKGRSLVPIEIKAAQTFNKNFLKNLKYFKGILVLWDLWNLALMGNIF